MSIVISKENVSNIILLKEDVNPVDVSSYLGEPGVEHYKLLALLSTYFNDVEIFDIGTYHCRGTSTAALSYNDNNKVISFNVNVSNLPRLKPNCQSFQRNLWNPSAREFWKERLLKSPLIFLDLHPHDGKMEFEFYNWLKDNEYKGILILDHIWHFKDMRDNLWSKISITKYDLTVLGHSYGTGIVDFSGKIQYEYAPKNTDNWTLVTAYFDLTKEPDASVDINKRPFSHYLQNANATMSVEQNLVVFCEEETKNFLENLRPDYLKHKTKYIIVGFNDFEIIKTRDQIIKNRQEKPYHFDNRNTASYYLFCMLRYIMIDRIIEENPFSSTHFAWINVCIERMGWKNVAALNNALSVNRNKFSTCYIDYQPKELVENYSEYFKFGRCGMCSGFFTGRGDYFQSFNKSMLESFYDCLEKGYGHADEQLFSIVYFKKPYIFEHYYGDYQEMITNYCGVVENIQSPIIHVIRNSYLNKNYNICLNGCLSVLLSYEKIPENLAKPFIKYLTMSAIYMKRWDILDTVKDKIDLNI
jgi:hypothetical protein